MYISGAAIIRNGVKLGFPFVESIKSVLPLCDEMVVAVGDSQDETRRRIESIGDGKIKIIDTKWDAASRSGGHVLSEQTNEAIKRCSGKWVFYIQSDEVVHEDDYGLIISTLAKADGKKEVEGIYFDYLHFYGSYSTVQKGRNWYSKEVRLIRNGSGIYSFGDAQGFRADGRKITACGSGARIFHYGWARPPEVMMEKIKSFHSFWHDEEWIKSNCSSRDVKDYFSDLGNLVRFKGTHPAVMNRLIKDDSDAFIEGCRAEYLKNRGIGAAIRDIVRSVPLGRHMNFKSIGI